MFNYNNTQAQLFKKNLFNRKTLTVQKKIQRETQHMAGEMFVNYFLGFTFFC